jgi:hypothetical protein
MCEVIVSRRDRIELMIWIAILMLAVVVVGQQPSGEVLRQIDDPGARGIWLLTRDPVHPAGPGRMIWVPNKTRLREAAEDGAAPAAAAIIPSPSASLDAARPVILAGDRVLVVEETPVVDARLTATALNPAPVGMAFHARLEIGGQVVRAVAVGPGVARLAPATESGVQP